MAVLGEVSYITIHLEPTSLISLDDPSDAAAAPSMCISSIVY